MIEEFINTVTVAEYLRENERMPEEGAADVIRTLKQFHDESLPVIHRGIKPSNVILSESSDVTLIDFDASKVCDRNRTRDPALI